MLKGPGKQKQSKYRPIKNSYSNLKWVKSGLP